MSAKLEDKDVADRLTWWNVTVRRDGTVVRKRPLEFGTERIGRLHRSQIGSRGSWRVQISAGPVRLLTFSKQSDALQALLDEVNET